MGNLSLLANRRLSEGIEPNCPGNVSFRLKTYPDTDPSATGDGPRSGISRGYPERNSFDIKNLCAMFNVVKCSGPLELQGQAGASLVAYMV